MAFLVRRRLSTIPPEPVEWLWPGWLPVGKLTLLLGDPGLGKSWLTLDMASRVTQGAAWPDGQHAPQGRVLICSAEDGVADTIRPRVDALGGDPERVEVAEAVQTHALTEPLTLIKRAHAEALGAAMTDIKLVVLDPLTAYLAGTDATMDTHVRSVLEPIRRFAESCRAAVLCVMHLNKAEQLQALHRGLLSIGFVALARTVLFAVPYRDETRALTVAKTNLGPAPTSLTYHIEDGQLRWIGQARDLTLQTLETFVRHNQEDHMVRQFEQDFLVAILSDGPRPATEIRKLANPYGFQSWSLHRALHDLGGRSYRAPGPTVLWMWALPADVTHAPDQRGLDGHVSLIVPS